MTAPAPLVVVQVAVVVPDLEAAVATYREVLGWGPWRVYDFRDLPHRDTTVRGRPTDFAMRTALCRVGEIDFEIVQPVGPSPYQDFLDERGPGLHHIQVRSADEQGMRARLDASGLPQLLGGRLGLGDGTDLEYAYHDGGDRLHLIVESTYGDRQQIKDLPAEEL